MEPVVERPALPFDLRGLVQSLIAVCQQYGQRINRLLRGPVYPITDAEVAAGLTESDLDTRYPAGNVLRYGADPTGENDSTDAFQTALDLGGVIVVPPGSGAYRVGDLTWDYSNGPTVISAYGARIRYTGSGDMLTATMQSGAASLDSLTVLGGEWYASSSQTAANSLFNLIDMRNTRFRGVLFSGDISNPVQRTVRAVTLRNKFRWCERNVFDQCEFERVQHAIVFEIDASASVNGGTQSFARTIIRDCFLNGGVSGECLIEQIDSTGGVVGEPGLYGSVIQVRGNIADGVVVMKLTGSMGGTVIGPWDVETPAPAQAYYFRVGTFQGTRPMLVGPFIDRQVALFDPAGTATSGHIAAQETKYGGFKQFNPTPNFGVDFLGRITEFAEDWANPYMAVSGTTSGGTGLDRFGHLIIAGQSADGRDIVVVTGATPEARLIIKADGTILLPSGLPEYADDSAASSGGLPVGGLYHSGGAVRIRRS